MTAPTIIAHVRRTELDDTVTDEYTIAIDPETEADEQDHTSVLQRPNRWQHDLELIEDFEDLEEDEPFDGPQTIIVVEPKPLSKTAQKKADKAAAKILADEAAKAAEEEARVAKLAALQACVPWKIVDEQPDRYSYQQKNMIKQWADDHGTYPERYRSYSRDEWSRAINQLAYAVNHLAETHPDYQRQTGLYVEEHTTDLLLIKAKTWMLQIQIPGKSTITGKRFTLTHPPDQESWNGRDARDAAFAELLTQHVDAEDRDTLLNICAQYLRPVRIAVNIADWTTKNPELAHLVTDLER